MLLACFDESPLAQAIVYPDGRFVRVNHAFHQLFGQFLATDFHLSGVLNETGFQFAPRPNLDEVWTDGKPYYFTIYDQQKQQQFNCRLTPKRHSEVMILMIDELGTASFYDKALSENVERLNSLLNCTSLFICRVSMDGRYSYGNESFLRHFGYTEETLSRDIALESVHPEDGEALRRAGMAVLENPQARSQCRIRKPNADRSQYYATAWEFTAITDGTGAVTEIQCVGTDINEVAEKEEKMAAYIDQLRQYNFDISHELRRPLTNVMGLMNLHKLATSAAEKEELLTLLEESILEMDAITKKITSKIIVDEVELPMRSGLQLDFVG